MLAESDKFKDKNECFKSCLITRSKWLTKEKSHFQWQCFHIQNWILTTNFTLKDHSTHIGVEKEYERLGKGIWQKVYVTTYCDGVVHDKDLKIKKPSKTLVDTEDLVMKEDEVIGNNFLKDNENFTATAIKKPSWGEWQKTAMSQLRTHLERFVTEKTKNNEKAPKDELSGFLMFNVAYNSYQDTKL